MNKDSRCLKPVLNPSEAVSMAFQLLLIFTLVIILPLFEKGAMANAIHEISEKKTSNYAYVKGDYYGIDQAAKSVFYVECLDSEKKAFASGSGFVMFDEGLFITNQHVIESASYLEVYDDDFNYYMIDQVIVSDAEHDIAILFFPEGRYYKSLEYDTSFGELKRGQPVLAIGSPKGMPGTVSDGIIGAFPRFAGEDTRYIQITAPISHGSSGGCLLNDDLKVIGVTSAGLEDGENIGFAVPVFIVEELYKQWNKRDTIKLGSMQSWDTVGYGLHGRVSGSADRPKIEPTSKQPTASLGTTLNRRDFITVGNIVTFGHYEQDNNTSNGQESIEWLVLDYDAANNRALLLSRYGLDPQPYNKEPMDITWENCTLRTWLNNEFLSKAFTNAEQGAILTTAVDNSKSQGCSGWNTNGGNNTQDKVFLLSYAEANRYLDVTFDNTFDNSNNMKSRVAPTAYAVKQGAEISSNYKTGDGAGAGWWWLRSPGYYQNYAAFVNRDGSLNYNRVSSVSLCVRPALWINLESDIF